MPSGEPGWPVADQNHIFWCSPDCPRYQVIDPIESLREALQGRYAVERLIGQGGMATVYLARDSRHDRPVAIKVLRPELAASIGSDRFLREIKVAAHLQHPHILPLYDSGEAADYLYYVMPFVDGESLRARMDREGQLPLPEAIQLTCEVADGLHYAHTNHRIVHRDIKPENILIQGGHALVADFGIARAVSQAGGRFRRPRINIGCSVNMSCSVSSNSKRKSWWGSANSIQRTETSHLQLRRCGIG